MIDRLRSALHLGPDPEESRRSSEVIARVNRAVRESAEADRELAREVIEHYPDTDLAAALMRAQELRRELRFPLESVRVDDDDA